MKHMLAYKLTTLILVMVAIAAMAARAQEPANGVNGESVEEITNFDDVFGEKTAGQSTNDAANASVNKNANDLQIAVTVPVLE